MDQILDLQTDLDNFCDEPLHSGFELHEAWFLYGKVPTFVEDD